MGLASRPRAGNLRRDGKKRRVLGVLVGVSLLCFAFLGAGDAVMVMTGECRRWGLAWCHSVPLNHGVFFFSRTKKRLALN